MKKKQIFFTVMLIFVALVAFTVIFTVHHSEHCTDVECEMCAQAQSVKETIESLIFVLSAITALFLSLTAFKYLVFNVSETVLNFTPVKFKVKLSN